ncbi:expressed unknown protein [Seminavis robusta]|uniref:Uncharacterized protein n=1 Tax=Seminavis robusta TaxID=568900 RepID=A0A9N8DGW0_9STRA|nr:expressed unknown protein [Seminavis robusta]|eukprot:Sro136_g064130.1 n/a (421) ;mRNA; r:62762-64315
MSVVEWKRLAEQSLHVLIPLHGGNEPMWNNPTGNQLVGCSHKFPLRGDTSAVLMNLVESCLISQLERARTMAFHRTRHDPSQYPSVSLVDFQAQDQLHSFLFTTGDVKTSGTIYPGLKLLGLSPLPAVKAAIDSGVNFDETKRFQIVRRLAYAAGITKMDNAMFDLVWAQLVQLIIMLLWPGCVRLVHDEIQNDPGARQNLHGVQTMRDVPPPSYRSARPHACAVCEEQNEIVHTIVPGQVEHAAKGLGIAHKVYGLEWHVETDNDETSHEKSFQLLLKELAKAESKYSFERKKAPSQTTDDTAPYEGNIVDGSNAGQILVDGLLFFDALEEEPKGSASVIGETRQHKLISTETDATHTSGGKVSSDEDSEDLQISDEGIVVFDEDSDNEETTCISPSAVVQESTGYHDRIYVRELLAPI